MGKYDDQSEERSPSNAANPMGSSVPVADGRAEDFFSQGATLWSFLFFSTQYSLTCADGVCPPVSWAQQPDIWESY